MLFSQFSHYLQQLEQISSRNQMTEILASLFKKAGANEIDKMCYLLTGRLAPKFRGIEFQMAEKMMLRAIAKAYGWQGVEVRAEFKKRGDLGGTIESLGTKISSLMNSPAPPKRRRTARTSLRSLAQTTTRSEILSPADSCQLQVSEVYNKLMVVAREAGSGSVERKIKGMAELLTQLDGLSAKYTVRIPVNKLRLGFSDMTILDALSWMVKADKSLREQLERAFNVSADIGRIARVFKALGMAGLKKIKAVPGIPIRPAQAERLPSASKIMEKLGRGAVEPKFDGLRVQIHVDNRTNKTNKTDRTVKIFSRNLDNMTAMFPDIAAAGAKLKVKNAILDGEAIGVDAKTGRFLAFQETVQRKRKYGIAAIIKQIPIKVFLFDCLYADGRSLLKEPFAERRKVLEKIVLNR